MSLVLRTSEQKKRFYVNVFGSLEEFQDEFKDINQEEQISKLHKMLAPIFLEGYIFGCR
ncbi:hypothetical protein ACB098_11G145100 [Castanea mollissima]